MSLGRIDLIIHPVRLRILQTLMGETLTTQEIAKQLPDVPASSIYRHLKLLLDGGIVDLAETRLVHGIQEKVYQLAASPHLDAADMADLPVEEHLRLFTAFVLALLRDFVAYLERAAAQGDGIDMLADYAGYREVAFYATAEEMDRFQATMQEALLALLENKPGRGRHRHKIATVAHPVSRNQSSVNSSQSTDN